MEGSRVKGVLARGNSVYETLALGEARCPRELEEAQEAAGGEGGAQKEGRSHAGKGCLPAKEPEAAREHRETTGFSSEERFCQTHTGELLLAPT